MSDELVEARGNMRPCGCHRGRPCTCEMGKQSTLLDYACGECINCQLNAKALQKKRKATRKCVKYDEHMAEMNFDRLEIAPGCVLRMRKPNWDVAAKSPFYTQMRQVRLALIALRIESAVGIERQVALRKKYNRDLLVAEQAIQRIEETRANFSNPGTRKNIAEVTLVDSDMFDSHSKQLIPAETLLPELRSRLETANTTITTLECNLKVVEAYVCRVGVTKLQATVREFLRVHRWKHVYRIFQYNVAFAAAVTIQATYRMSQAKQKLQFVKEIQNATHKQHAAHCLQCFFRRVAIARRLRVRQLQAEAQVKALEQKKDGVNILFRAMEKIVCRLALWTWKARQREATTNGERKRLKTVVTIQRYWRGFRERLYYQRTRYRHLLSEPVRVLYDRFVGHGDLWRLLFDVDAAFKRYENRERNEHDDATTFLSRMVREKREYEDKMMQAWLTASALENPIVNGAHSMMSAFGMDGTTPMEGFPLSQAIQHSPLASDLISLSQNNAKNDVFPDDLPPQIIRQATYAGFTIAETVAVMRGLLAQGKDAGDVKLVLKVLRSRAPLMRNALQPERVVRQKLRPTLEAVAKPAKRHELESSGKTKSKIIKKKPMAKPQQDHLRFLSDNMIDNIPGGLSGAVARLLFVAGLKCYDPDARGGGDFVFRIEASADPWRSYLGMASPLSKIHREQVVQEAIKPHVQKLKEHQCFSAFDILRNVRGMDEMVAWGIPRPLVVTIYDVIELIHQQTVDRSDRNLSRQMRVSAQFEAFAEKKHQQNELLSAKGKPERSHSTRMPRLESPSQAQQIPTNHAAAMAEVAAAINRDVLELPITAVDTPVASVLFKAYFLTCDGESHRNTPPTRAASNQRANTISRMHSRDNYERFLSYLVDAQLAGDAEAVKQLVRERIKTASRLADESNEQLKQHGITRVYDLQVLSTIPCYYLSPDC